MLPLGQTEVSPAVDDVVKRLSQIDLQQARVVELRFGRAVGEGDSAGHGNLSTHGQARMGDGAGLAASRTRGTGILMTAERWARLKEIFSTTLEKAEQERSAYLDSACAGDTELRAEIERLLAEEHRSDFHSPVSGMLRLAPDLSMDAVLGKHRIVEKLGEGRMGVVYAAQDTVLHRAVALKVLPREGDTTAADLPG